MDAQAEIAGDPSEAGSVLYDQGPNIGPLTSAANPGGMPPPPQMMSGTHQQQNNNPIAYDPMADESLFVAGNNIRANYMGNEEKRGMFDDSMMGGGNKGIFDETMRDVSMSMDQDLSKHDISRIFGSGNRMSAADNQMLTVSSQRDNFSKTSGKMFDKIEEEDEEDKFDNYGSKVSPPVHANTKNKVPKKGFLDDTMNEEEDIDGSKFLSKPPAHPSDQKNGMFMDSFTEEDSNASMLFPVKKRSQNNPPPSTALPGMANPKSTAFDYGKSSEKQQTKPAFFDSENFEEEESVLFPEKNSSVAGMFADVDDPNESMISQTSGKSFIEKEKLKNKNNHMMAMIMNKMNPKKNTKRLSNEISIGDKDDEVPEPAQMKVDSQTTQKKGPADCHQSEAKKKPFNFLDETHEGEEDMKLDIPKKNEPMPLKDTKKMMFMDDTLEENEIADNLDFSKKPTPPDPITETTTLIKKKVMFMDDEDSDDDDFIFGNKAKPNAASSVKPTPPQSIVQNSPQKKKPFMFEEEESFIAENSNVKIEEKKETPQMSSKVETQQQDHSKEEKKSKY